MYVPKMALSNVYRMWELQEGRNYFQELFDECNHTFVEISLPIFVTYCSYPNPIPRDRHSHLAGACCTTQSRYVHA